MPRAWVAGPAHTGAAPWPAGWRLTGSFCLNNPSHCMGELRDGCWLLLKFNSLPCIICQPYPHSSFLVSATREEAGRADCPWRWQLMGSCSLPAHTAMPSLHWGHGSPKHTPLGLHTTWGTMLISILCRLNTVLVSLSRWEWLTLAINHWGYKRCHHTRTKISHQMASFPFTHREALRDLPRKSWTWEEAPSGDLPRDLWPSFVSLCCSKASKRQAVYFNCPKSKLLRFPHPAAAWGQHRLLFSSERRRGRECGGQ